MSENLYGDNPFLRMKRDLEPEQLRATLAASWEEARVLALLSRTGLAEHRNELRHEATRRGVGRVTFSLFHELFPDFPVTLRANNLGETQEGSNAVLQTPLSTWYKTFRKLPFMAAYAEMFEELGAVTRLRPFGLVFPWKEFQQGFIVHNGDMSTYVPENTGCFVYVGDTKKATSALVVQPFINFLDAIHRRGHGGWVPSSKTTF